MEAEWDARRSLSSPMGDSRQGLAGYYRYQPRKLEKLTNDCVALVRIARPKIHESVFRRIQHGATGYAPIVLPGHYAIAMDDGTIQDLPTAAGGLPNVSIAVETEAQAAERGMAQERVWDLVWWRRVVYALTVLSTLAVAVSPWLPFQSLLLPWALPTVSKIIGLLSSFVPSMTAPWLTHFRQYPVQLIAGLAVVGWLMFKGGSLQVQIDDEMRRIWRKTPKPVPGGWVRALRDAAWYRRFFAILTHTIVPNVFGLAMLVTLIFAGALLVVRLTIDVPMLTGYLCEDAKNPTEITQEMSVPFDNRLMCQATGLLLKAGADYEIDIQLPPVGDWKDREHVVDTLTGFASGSIPSFLNRSTFRVAVALRRHMSLNWFVPVARIGRRGDEYVTLTRQTSGVKPQANGQLFLYVNDAIGIGPWQSYFYDNNGGEGHARALVTVRLKPDDVAR